MTEVTVSILFYLVLINIFTFILFGVDKRNAVKRRPRIRNFTLFLFSALGGSVGGLFGMFIFRHKTTKLYYLFGIPLILILQFIVLYITVFPK